MGGGGAMGGGGLPGLGGSGTGGGGGGSLTEKLALQMALQNASTGTMGFLQGGGSQRTMHSGTLPQPQQQQMTGSFNRTPPVAGAHNYRTRPCRYFQQGMCKNGDQCTFLHTRESSGSVSQQQQPSLLQHSGGGYGMPFGAQPQQQQQQQGGTFNQGQMRGGFAPQHTYNM